MPVVHIASSDGKKTQKAAYKRRRDQNSEIGELGALLPWSQKGTGIDKISILRLTTAYMRFKNFWQSCKWQLLVVVYTLNDVILPHLLQNEQHQLCPLNMIYKLESNFSMQ
jgi:hypothetical protein